MLWTADSIHDFTKADHQKSPSVINRPFPSSFQPSISKHGANLSYEYHVFIHIESRTNYHKNNFLLTFKKH